MIRLPRRRVGFADGRVKRMFGVCVVAGCANRARVKLRISHIHDGDPGLYRRAEFRLCRPHDTDRVRDAADREAAS